MLLLLCALLLTCVMIYVLLSFLNRRQLFLSKKVEACEYTLFDSMVKPDLRGG